MDQETLISAVNGLSAADVRNPIAVKLKETVVS